MGPPEKSSIIDEGNSNPEQGPVGVNEDEDEDDS